MRLLNNEDFHFFLTSNDPLKQCNGLLCLSCESIVLKQLTNVLNGQKLIISTHFSLLGLGKTHYAIFIVLELLINYLTDYLRVFSSK